MTMQTVSLSSLEPGRGNPRKAMDRNGLEGLAASIRNDGLLQNLVVKPVKGKGQHYRIVSGERRYRALKLLQERGELDEDFGVPVEIRVSLSHTGNADAPMANVAVVPPAVERCRSSTPPPGFTSSITSGEPGANVSRNITPAFADAFVFCRLVTRAIICPSPDSDCQTN